MKEPKIDILLTVSEPPFRVQEPHVSSSQATPVQPLQCTIASGSQACSMPTS